MGNISKKTRKKLIKVIEANCHRVTHFGEQDAMFVPYDSSPLSAIWKYLCIRNDDVITGRFLVDRSEKYIPFRERYCCINAPEQLFVPRTHIEMQYDDETMNPIADDHGLRKLIRDWDSILRDPDRERLADI